MTDGSARAVALDPQWLPHTYSADGATLTSVLVPRSKHDALMFLSDEFYQGQYTKVSNSAADVAAHAGNAASAPIHFIFHTAFCCSTLLAKALDVPGRALALKEPDVLINVANRITQSDDSANRERLRLVLRLLSRPFEAGETVVVKPTNFANRLAQPVLEALPQARLVLLHSDLPTLLRSIVKRGIWGRIWARKLYRSAAAWTSLQLGYGPGETFELSDLQVAGLSWLMQIHHFREVALANPSRTMIIESADFIGNVAPTLERVASFFDLGLDGDSIASIATGPVFSRHSKFSQRDYSVDAREAEHDKIVLAHGEEIDVVVKWIEAVAGHCRVPLDPAAPL